MFYENLTNEVYHARSEVSRSMILEILGKIKSEATQSLSFGAKMHAYLFEPDVFKTYKVVESKTTTRDGCITQCEMDKIKMLTSKLESMDMIKTLLFHPFAIKEKAIFGQLNGVDCRIKPDCFVIDNRRKKVLMLDYKTTSSQLCSENQIASDVIEYGYDVQAAFYIDVLKSNKVFQELYKEYTVSFYFIAQEIKTGLIRIFTIDEDSLQVARTHVEIALDKYKEQGVLATEWQQSDLPNDILVISTLDIPEYKISKSRPKLFLNVC